ncbi:unnamed protein product [Cyprideis torosa]|uniref:Protein kinase domain-containing protein n=1 Tax=Cyprideis torosa TaxID=163714 RepID=A0A7R8W6M3_9CRUS|nr:unnamed protein product [Cyprideis torosa]CAG0881223.1 unnamed protein product [Cyprideis torosa]
MADPKWKERIGVEVNFSDDEDKEAEDEKEENGSVGKARKRGMHGKAWEKCNLEDIALTKHKGKPSKGRDRFKNPHRKPGEKEHGVKPLFKAVTLKPSTNAVRLSPIPSVQDLSSKPDSMMTDSDEFRRLPPSRSFSHSMMVSNPVAFPLRPREGTSPELRSLPHQHVGRYKFAHQIFQTTGPRSMGVRGEFLYPLRMRKQSSLPLRSRISIQRSTLGDKAMDERVSFHRVFQELGKLGTSESTTSLPMRQPSFEEELLMRDLCDQIWLELHAFHAGHSTGTHAAFLQRERSRGQTILEEIMTFRFQLPNKSCEGCLSVFCAPCTENVNEGLQEANKLLEKYFDLLSLYPTSKALCDDCPLNSSPTFIMHLNALLSWVNITESLRSTCNRTGRILFLLSGRSLPWPDFITGGEVVFEDIVGNVTRESTPMSPDPVAQALLEEHRFRRSMSAQSSSAQSLNGGVGGIGEEEDMNHRGPFRRFVDRWIKTRGMKQTMAQLKTLIKPALDTAYSHLAHPEISTAVPIGLDPLSPPGTEHYFHGMPLEWSDPHWTAPKQAITVYSPDLPDLGLPSFRGVYLFLVGVSLRIVDECLLSKLEQQPNEPSTLSVRQLIRECKESLKQAVEIRQQYLTYATPALASAKAEEVEKHVKIIERLDRKAKEVLQFYLKYLHILSEAMQKEEREQRTFLEEEWGFVKDTCRYIRGGEALAAKHFCTLAASMFSSTGDALESALDKLASCDLNGSLVENEDPSAKKQQMLVSCREMMQIFHETRTAAIKAVSFSKMLRCDLEIAAEYQVLISSRRLMQILANTGHVRVQAPYQDTQLMFVPDSLCETKEHKDHILDLLDMTLGHPIETGLQEDYLLILSCESETSLIEEWMGETVSVLPSVENTIALSHLQFEGLLLVVNQSSQLEYQKDVFEAKIQTEADRGSPTLSSQSCPPAFSYTSVDRTRNLSSMVPQAIIQLKQSDVSPHHVIAVSCEDLKNEVISLAQLMTRCLVTLQGQLDPRVLSLSPEDTKFLQGRCREVIQHCFHFNFEYHRELWKVVTGVGKKRLALMMLDLADVWMNFVLSRCDRGKGVRPQWTNQGVSFLIATSDPEVTRHIDDKKFKALKEKINQSVSHLVGDADQDEVTHSTRPVFHVSYSTPMVSRPSPSASGDNLAAMISCSSGTLNAMRHSASELESIISRSPSLQSVEGDRSTRLVLAIEELESERESSLRHRGLIGRVLDEPATAAKKTIRHRTVNFTWQRGNKIGQGRYGKVFTAVNNLTGELMAMKELEINAAEDHKAIQGIFEEFQILEGIKHQHLVGYYGIEVHRNMMLIFMEYCEEGTLEYLCETFNGLPEPLVRRYTNQLLQAVNSLHEHGIVHRDIKGANIFLTNNGDSLKLGDFGCAIKLKRETFTYMNFDAKGFVGTPAFMAPEVLRTENGYGRPADIWSVGCVVIEMCTGKRPWPKLESHIQIIYRIGFGHTPPIPSNLGPEGISFMSKCLEQDPAQRATAVDLLDHPFVKVCMDEFMSLPDALEGIGSGFGETDASKKPKIIFT